MANLFTLGFGKVSDLIGKLAEAGLTAEMAEEVRKNPALAEAIVNSLKAQPVFTLVHGLFTHPETQIVRVREWNKEFGWGIPDEAFAEMEKSVPAWPEDKLIAVVLVPYLADKTNADETVTSGLERTFHELWARAEAKQDANWHWGGYDKAGPDKLRLLKGIEHKPGLRWEVIDMGCNRNQKPVNVRNPEKSPHAGVLASAMLHPQWIKSMDGENVPYVWAPGYEVNVSGEGPWQGVPRVDFNRGDRGIRLGCGWYGSCDPEGGLCRRSSGSSWFSALGHLGLGGTLVFEPWLLRSLWPVSTTQRFVKKLASLVDAGFFISDDLLQSCTESRLMYRRLRMPVAEISYHSHMASE